METTVSHVRDLTDATIKQWNMEMVRDVVDEVDVVHIQNLRLGSLPTQDLLGCSYTDFGLYIVKSGYWLATHLPIKFMISSLFQDHLTSKRLFGEHKQCLNSDISFGESFRNHWQ